ncbi:hypothetical protein CMI48_03715 [Candidatus Pacearchaeota archaeon]|nr:hypothetical protein [Candidatus Pacearchaeota archaeon]
MFHTISLKHPIEYGMSSLFSFLIELGLLFAFLTYLQTHYLIAAAIAFTVGASINYNINRRWIFHHPKLSYQKGWITFVVIGVIGVGITLALLALIVEVFQVNVILSRVLVGAFVFLWNFGMNTYITFQEKRK